MSVSMNFQNAVTLLDTVNENLRRAKAISDLVGAASMQSTVEIDDSIRDAMLIVWELADSANGAANSLFELIQKEQEGARHDG